MVNCPNCGTPNPAGFKFCGNCASPLAAAAPQRSERRKVVTVLFCDVVGSTSLGEQRDPETMRAVMNRYFETARAVLERHGGTVEKFIGDAVMAVFGHPVLHEDDALRAVHAADELRSELADLNDSLRREWGIDVQTRMGVNTGPVIAGEPGSAETIVTGDTVNVAARLQTNAESGQTLIGTETYQLVRDAVVAEAVEPLALKGKDAPVGAWRLLSVEREATLGRARHLDTPLVGRERELRALNEAFDQAVADQSCVMFTLLGSAGVGKSRLVHEFVTQARERAQLLRGRCLPYGEGITFWPLAEVVKQAAGIEEADSGEVARAKVEAVVAADDNAAAIALDIATAIGLTAGAGRGEEIFWAVRRFLELLAAERPLVVIFDDIHWAEPTLLDLIEHIADWTRDAPVLLLCIARPELLELRATWGGGKLNASTLMLGSLPPEQVNSLVENLLGQGALPRAVVERVASAAEGNPLFVEEFVAMLIDDGLLRGEAGSWTAVADVERVTVPPTIRSLLAARIDRLGKSERSVIERAAVVGKVFWRGAIAELAPDVVRQEVPTSLLALVRKELVRPDRSDFAGDDAFRFRHLLVRDAAYEGLPKQERALLHERFAAWLERIAGERVGEYEEVLGHHLDQAFRYRSELGPLDDAGRDLSLRAARRLAAAGMRANDRADAAASRKLLGRASALFPADHPERLAFVPELARAMGEAGQFEEAFALLDEGAETAERAGNQSTYWRCRVQRASLMFFTNAEKVYAYTEEVIREAIPILEPLQDETGLAEAYDLEHHYHYFIGDIAEGRRAGLESIKHAERAGDIGLTLRLMNGVAALYCWDDTPISTAISAAMDALAQARAANSRQAEASALGIVGRLKAYAGEVEEGRQMVGEARNLLLELGREMHAAGATHWQGAVEWAAGDLHAGEDALRRGAIELERLGEKSMLSTSLAELAKAIAQQGRYQDAIAESERAESISAPDDFAAEAEWRLARAIAYAGLGDYAKAGPLADEALGMIDRSGYVLSANGYRLDLADVIAHTHGVDRARQLLSEAIAFFERKEMPLVAERARAKLAAYQGVA